MLPRMLGALVIAIGLLFATSPAVAAPGAKDAKAAKKAVARGRKFEWKKDYEKAKEAYELAIELNDRAAVRVRLAAVEAKIGLLVEAADQLRVALDAKKKKLSYVQRVRAKRTLKKLEKRIPVLKLELPFSFDGKVEIDDRELDVSELGAPIPLNPGSHDVKATADGYQPFKQSIELAEKDEKNLTVLMTELPKEEPKAVPEATPEKKSGSNTLAYVAIGVGVVGLAVGSYMGLKARSTKKDLDSACRNGVCSESQRDLYDQGKSQANISTVGFIVGAVGIGAGTVLLLTGGEKEGKIEARRLSPYVGLGHAGVAGQF